MEEKKLSLQDKPAYHQSNISKMEQNNSTKPNIAQLKEDAKKKVLYPGIAALGLGIAFFFYASYLDGLTESIKINAMIAMIYNNMGTMGGTTLLGGIGVFLIVVFAFKMMNIKKLEQQA